MKKGKIIFIEGNDQHLKSIQTNLLLNKLRRNSIKSTSFDLGGKDFTCFGEDKSRDYRISCLHHAAERLSYYQKIKDEIYAGRNVLLEGYVESSMASLGRIYDRQKSKVHDYLAELEYKTHGLPKPDKYFFLTFYPRNNEREEIEKSFQTNFRRADWEKIRILEEDKPEENLIEDLYDISIKLIES